MSISSHNGISMDMKMVAVSSFQSINLFIIAIYREQQQQLRTTTMMLVMLVLIKQSSIHKMQKFCDKH